MSDEGARYGTKQVSARTGISERELRRWREDGIAPASASTQGGHARYTEADLRRVRIVALLRTKTVHRRAIPYATLRQWAEDIERAAR